MITIPVNRKCRNGLKRIEKSIQTLRVNLYKEYTHLKSRELEELPRF